MCGKHNDDKPTEVETTDSINRRSFVKTVGAAGGAAMVGGAGAGSAAAKPSNGGVSNINKATQAQVDHALESDEIRELRSAIGRPAVQRGRAKHYDVALDESTGGGQIDLITLPTNIGQMMYSETSSGTTEADFLFAGSLDNQFNRPFSPGLRNQLPAQYQNLPDVGAKLAIGDNKMVLGRFATSSEQKQLAQLTGVSPQDMKASVNSEDNVFRVTPKKSGSNSYLVDPQTEDLAYEEVTSEVLKDATVERPVTTQQSCSVACAECLAAIGGGCAFTCGAVCITVVTLAGVAACAVCAVTFCATGPLICQRCNNCV